MQMGSRSVHPCTLARLCRRTAIVSGESTVAGRPRRLPRGGVLSLLLLILGMAGTARAEDSPWALDNSVGLALGRLSLMDGTPVTEFGVARDFGEHFLLRASLGLFAWADRHALIPAPYLRLEGATEVRTDRTVVPRLGGGVTFWLDVPQVHGLIGVGRNLSDRWTMALDMRAGPIFHDHTVSPAAELQLRCTHSF